MVMLDGNTNVSNSENGDAKSECKQSGLPNVKRQSQQQQQQTSTNQNGNTNGENNPEVLLAMLLHAMKKLWAQIKQASNYVMVDLGGYQLFDRLTQWCVQHPQMAICLLAAGLVGILPILLFVAFILSTIAMTFTGFLVLEGTLLTILTMMMFGLLGALVVMLLFFAIVGVATYFGVAHAYDIYGNTQAVKISLRNATETRNQFSTQSLSGNTHVTGNSRGENVVL